ncbi:MAG: hypothetical protein DMG60_04320 [Acidobacteria bacterium]|nr:MAG: hypothetical protein DMG60_04320 [Acidobacteriota bacterium]
MFSREKTFVRIFPEGAEQCSSHVIRPKLSIVEVPDSSRSALALGFRLLRKLIGTNWNVNC